MRCRSPLVFTALASVLATAGTPTLVHAAPEAATKSALRQVAGILDYIGSDYSVAVDDQGKVVNELEYEEQLKLVQDARSLARDAGLADDDPIIEGLDELEGRLKEKPPPDPILRACNELRRTLVDVHDVVLRPPQPPERKLGARLYEEQGCPSCHGADGAAETPQARTLEPPPADFLDRERMAGVSPHRAFYAISHGVDGTSMQGYPQLSDHERWSLAFWVASLRGTQRDTDTLHRGRRALEEAGWPIEPSLPALAHLRPADARETLRAELGDDADAEAALGWLRARAPFRDAPERKAPKAFTVARTHLDQGLAAYREGDAAAAGRHFIAAYLEGFEPREATVRAREAALVRRVEQAMLALRETAGRGAPVSEVEDAVARVETLLDRAARSDDEGTLGAVATFAGSGAIALREGFEAVLLVLALLALVRSRGERHHARWVHAGWFAALPAGALTWFAVGHLISGLERELAEGIVALVAAAVLLAVTHWFIGEISMRQGMSLLARQIGRVRGRAAAAVVFTLAFVAVYREAVEVVLFYQALALEAAEHINYVWLGAAAGLGALVVAALGLHWLGRKMKPRPFMIASSIALALLTLILVGKGVHALQEAGVVGVTTVGMTEVPALGVHATVETLLAQGALLLALIASTATGFRPRRRRDRTPRAATGETPGE